jgi:lipid A 3-O-deacylase
MQIDNEFINIRRSKQNTYLTTYGEYKDRLDAIKTITNFPKKLKDLDPYIIEISSVEEIKPEPKKSTITKTYVLNYPTVYTKSEKSDDIKIEQKSQQPISIKEKNFLNSFSLGFGINKESRSVYRVAVQKDLGSAFGYKELESSLDFSISQFNFKNDDIKIVALSPVFTYKFDKFFKYTKPYIKAGIGVSYIDKTFLDDKGFSTHFQFEDRIAFGIDNGDFDLSLNYIHYSNASIKKPNDGLDTLLLSLEVPIN